MKSLNIILFIIAAYFYSSAAFSQEKTSPSSTKEVKTQVYIVKDDNGKVQEFKKEFDSFDSEEMEQYFKEKGIDIRLDKEEGDLSEGKFMKIIMKNDDDTEEEQTMIMELKSFGDSSMKFNQTFDFNWVGDSSLGHTKIMRFNCDELSDSGNVFIIKDAVSGGELTKTVQSIFILRKNGEQTGDDFTTTVVETRMDELPIEDFNMYPNPNDGVFNTEFNVVEKSNVEIKIVDTKGSVVYERELNNFSGNFKDDIDLSKEKAGLYLFNIQIGDKLQSKKILLRE